MENCAKEAGITPMIKVEADSYSTLKELVRSGHGLTILPLAPIHDEIAAGNLTYAPLTDPSPMRKLMMAYPMDRPVTRLTKFASNTLHNTACDMVGRGQWAGRVLSGVRD